MREHAEYEPIVLSLMSWTLLDLPISEVSDDDEDDASYNDDDEDEDGEFEDDTTTTTRHTTQQYTRCTRRESIQEHNNTRGIYVGAIQNNTRGVYVEKHNNTRGVVDKCSTFSWLGKRGNINNLMPHLVVGIRQ